MNRKIFVLSGFTFILLIAGFFYHKFTDSVEITDNPAFSSSLHQQVESDTISKTLIPTLALLSGQQDSSYHFISGNGNQYLAEATLGNFRVGFENDGIVVESSLDSQAIRMNLSAIGYGESSVPVSEAEPTHEANLIEYHRGDLIEWYVNSPLGLEQGFTLMTQPSVNEEDRKLNILIDINGDKDLSATIHGSTVKLAKANWTNAIHYGGLYAYDTTGRELPSELKLKDGRITIQVDDRGAVYPVVVDPFIQVAKLTDPNPEDSDSGFFGNGVSIDGDTAVIGAPFRDVDGISSQGAAFVFERDNSGMWNFGQMLTASDGSVGDEFGWDVAIDGDRALIGARQNGVGGGDAGAAYIFERDGIGNWSQVQILTASDGVLFDSFGVEVSLDGERAIIGAPDHNVGANLSQGSAYIFERNLFGNWTEVANITSSDGAAIDNFGSGVAIRGDTAMVGAIGNNASRGAAYVFVRDGLGVWNEEQKLTASDAMIGDALGNELFIDGDTAAINAFLADGASYIFERNAMGIWVETQKLSASDANTAFGFGGVAIEGDRLIIGATEGLAGPGSAYIFEINALGMWEEVQIIGPGDEGGLFGLSVSLSGDRAIVGTPRDELGTEEFKGSAYIFELDSDGDGVVDDLDECPDSDLSETVVIDGCDSGVDNVLVENGCTISDLIAEIAGDAKNHGKFVSGVSHLLNQLKKSGIITGNQKGAIQSCAAMADIP